MSKTGLSALLSLTGMSLILRHRVAWGAALLGLAGHFHLFNAFAAILLFFPFGFLSTEPKNRKTFLFQYFLIPIVILSPFALKNLGWDEIHLPPAPLKVWYSFVDQFNDTYLWENLAPNLKPCLFVWVVPFLMSSRGQGRIDRIKVGILIGILSLIAFLLIDELHHRFIFFGKLSELYAMIEMRRGVWVMSLMSVFFSAHVFFKRVSTAPRFLHILIATLYVFLLMRWSSGLGIAFLILLACGLIGEKKLTICRAILLLSLLIVFLKGDLGAPVAIRSFMRDGIEFFLAGIFSWITWKQGGRYSFLSKNTLIAENGLLIAGISSVTLSTMIAYAFTHPYCDDFKIIRDSGLLKQVNKSTLLEMRHKKEQCRGVPTEDYPHQDALQVANVIGKMNPSGQLVFSPLSLDYAASRSPEFFNYYLATHLILYSRVYAAYYDRFLNEIYGKGLQELFAPKVGSETNVDRLVQWHSGLSATKIQELHQKYHFTWLISPTSYLQFSRRGKVGRYFIYQL